MSQTQGSTIRDILVVVDLGGERRATVVAADLARRTGAHLTGLSLVYDPTIPVYTFAAPIPTDFVVAAREQSETEAKAAMAAFEAIGQRAGIPIESRLGETLTGDGFLAVIRNAIFADIAVIGQDDPDRPEPSRDTLIEALLFQAGVPTLVVPFAGVSEFVPDKVVIGWNGSAAAGRAVRAAMPLLATAKEVLVAMVDEGREQVGEPGADIGAYLARHDLNVTVRTIGDMPNGAGQALLSFAADEEANWMVMGAYGHSRIREFLLGGATRHILANATLPILMSH
ncbi:universal stress protein [Bauldia litoralis]|uniref:Universal stress protein family protein n=1 Tax=Bauldia litoralis TaxID=665467 RepID=A0A1G6CP70_9HYPH|nr:universal stress protein [Bauldia litoralis]SDB34525.1 Universal stress protein family protein [Bauldia litoralis]